MKPSNQRVVIILGPPGSGKGTQANLLAEKLSLLHLETSSIIESHLRNAKEGEAVTIDGVAYLLDEEKKLRDTGQLMSPPLIHFWLAQRVRELHQEGKSIVFSGSPRTLYEAEQLMPVLEELYGKEAITVLNIELSEEDSLFRNSHRRICELMRHSVLYSPETANLKTCILDGSALVSRGALDDPETIKKRLVEYRERTLPILDFLKTRGFVVVTINGAPSVAEVFGEILKNL